MNDPEYPPALRDLQPAALQALHHRPQAQQGALAAQLASNLSGLDNTENFQRRLQAELNGPSHGQQHLQPVNAFDPNRHLHPSPSNAALQTPRQQQHAEHAGGQFGVLTPESGLAARNAIQHATVGRLQQDANPFQTPEQTGAKGEGHFQNMKMVPDPPNLEDWRQKLFDVNEMITLTEDEFQIYFPHVDNIYSHRSTQRYKRKPFVSHYWDCRLKGRPPGTPKSDDPNKKKRRRTARPRDLCDVKIKITEYFPSEGMGQSFPNPAPSSPSIHVNAATSSNFFAPGQPGGPSLQQQHQSHPMLPPTSSDGIPAPPPGSQGGRFYTIQRVNGNGGNGKGDGIAGPHKHTLEDSDRVKKNSVMRSMLKEDKEKKKAQYGA
ncbi:MAG: hypothetical protein M1819_000159 [Sarea resinae]|nr:MAG: hypothetical protein M1819_000159 [Sarea resinae]